MSATESLYSIPVKSLAGESTTLSAFKGKALLIVNVASQCGYTPQYKGLQELQDKYGAQGFTVLGFPSNDFGSQEPGSNAEIKEFCDLKYRVKFPMFDKQAVKGEKAQPLYQFLTKNAPEKGDVSWNFEKFLVSPEGKVVGRYKSKVAPDNADLVAAIESQLKKK